MSRKTWSFGAIGLGAIASLVFAGAYSAEVVAQNSAEPVMAGADSADSADDAIELVPEQPAFVSQAVVQPLPERAAPAGAMSAASLRELVAQVDSDRPLSEEVQCLASAIYFESRGEPLAGQLAVAKVIINRADDPRFPANYCSVVHQPGQFSFVKKGRMPHIRTRSAAWRQAKAVARIAHQGLWESEAGEAVFFHATYVRPSWSQRKQRLAQIKTHIFYR
ncbi:MAG: cell wall hydrolase [Erythrobacter sp.]